MKNYLIAVALAISPFAAASAQATSGDSAACAANADGPAVLAYFDGLKDRTGKLRLELFPDAEGDFMQDDTILLKAGKTFKRIEIATPQSGQVAICMAVPRAGRYTMVLIHDRDGVRKFSLSDGVALPSNRKIGMKKPVASMAYVTVGSGVTTIRVKMNYFRVFGGFSPL